MRSSSLPPTNLLLSPALLALALVTPAIAQQVGPLVQPADPAARQAQREGAAAAPHVAERTGVAPLAELGASTLVAPELLEQLAAWNRAHRLPRHNGFVRDLPPRRVEARALAAASLTGWRDLGGGKFVKTADGRLLWGGKVRVPGAGRLRLHLAEVSLPRGARLWVHGGTETAGPFGGELLAPDGSLWTPSVDGAEIALDIEVPGGGAAARGFAFTVDQVAEIVVDADWLGISKDESCEVDASCYSASDFPGYPTARHAVAKVLFIQGRSGSQCTGQLLNDTAGDGAPYMLIANHCVSDDTLAASLEAYFDDYDAGCNGPPPEVFDLPRASGARVLATGDRDVASDFTLLRLDNLPTGRTFLGWNAAPSAVPDGTALYRLSHPEGAPQKYSVSIADSSAAQCSPPAAHFIYSDLSVGAGGPGSSGAAAMLANGQVVGQLLGGCGPDSQNPCDPSEHPVDGAFATSFPALAPFLTAGAGRPCSPGDSVLCLVGKRFAVSLSWTNQFNGAAGTGHALLGTDEAGYFYFTDRSNVELIVKILDFGTVFKVFYGELTDFQFRLTITDTKTGLSKSYGNTPGDCGGLDETAFPESAAFASVDGAADPSAGGSCTASAATLCLLGHRFAVSVRWLNQFSGAAGNGQTRSLSDLSGLFTFTDPGDLELVLKVVPFSNRIAFFYAALSDFAYDITVKDTRTGLVKAYHNPAGTYCGGLDNSAFPP